MAVNYLEELIAEWYEYQGYFVRRNIPVARRAKGGYECELDVVAYHPVRKHLVHLEPSMDADSWATREKRFGRKFEMGLKYIPAIFESLDLPDEIEQIAILVFASKRNHQTVGGGKLILIDELLEEIFAHLESKELASSAVPEHLSILRSFQFVTEYRDVVMRVWQEAA
jgi:hypothetical protein